MSDRIIRKGTIWKYKDRFGHGTIVRVLFAYSVAGVTWIAFMPIHRARLGGVMSRDDFSETFEWLSNT